MIYKLRIRTVFKIGRPKGSYNKKKTSQIKIIGDSSRTDYYCTACGKVRNIQKGNFYMSQSPLYKGNNGYMPICRDCLDKIYNHYFEVLGDEKSAVRRVCSKFDIYYSDSIYNATEKTSQGYSRMSAFVSKTNLRQYSNKTFDDTLDEEKEIIINSKDDVALAKEENPEVKITSAQIDRWGLGYTPEEYGFMDKHYKMLQTIINTDDPIQDVLARDLCDTKVQEFRCRASGDKKGMTDFKTLYQNTLKTANLKPRQTKETDATNPDECWGVFTKMVENHTPAEYYEDKKLFFDFDKIKDYYERFITRPMKNLFTGSREQDPEYSLVDDGDEQ